MFHTVKDIKDFGDFTEIVEHMEHHYWVFRGHSDCTYRIEPSLARFFRSHQVNIKPASQDPRELDSILKFRKSAHLHLQHLPAPSELSSWLAIMQHFGAPTRLLDFTFSPYVALFFALEGAAPKVDFGKPLTNEDLGKRYKSYDVHAVHLKSVRTKTEKILGHSKHPADEELLIGNKAKQKKEFLFFFEGVWRNQRQIAQQGLFMIPSKVDLDIEAFLRSCPSESKSFPETSWFTFRFPGGLDFYRELVTRLLKMNVNAEALFPGLEGIARSISMRYYEPKIRLR